MWHQCSTETIAQLVNLRDQYSHASVSKTSSIPRSAEVCIEPVNILLCLMALGSVLCLCPNWPSSSHMQKNDGQRGDRLNVTPGRVRLGKIRSKVPSSATWQPRVTPLLLAERTCKKKSWSLSQQQGRVRSLFGLQGSASSFWEESSRVAAARGDAALTTLFIALT